MNSSTRRWDACGVALTAQDAEAVQALERVVVGLTSHRADTTQHLDAVLARDPDLLLAHVIRGFGLKLLGRNDLAARALASSEHALRSWSQRGGSDRERSLTEALHAWCAGDPIASLRGLEDALAENPLDRLAVKLSHSMYFYLGMRREMRESLERVLPAWQSARTPGLGRVLGCYAFALTENGDCERGEGIGREALALGEIDPWGMHATLHAIHARERTEEALAWLREMESQLEGANNFRGHVYWHRAVLLTLLDRWDEALALYDTEIAIYPAHDYRDLVNEVTLLHRCIREGIDVGARAERCAATAMLRLGDHGSAFADVHHVLSLSLNQERAQAAAFIDSMRDRAKDPQGIADQVLAEVAVPIAEATLLIETHPARAHRAFESLRAVLVRMGGSRAQHAVFALLESDALRAIQHDENPLIKTPATHVPTEFTPS